MKILYIHNDYFRPSGEEHAAEAIVDLLLQNGHEVHWYRRSSAEFSNKFFGNLRAVFLSLYNPASVKSVRKLIKELQPDLVQVQNLYPLISPRVLKMVESTGLPVVMRCPNYRLFCPTGLFYDRNNSICEKCTGSGKELWCIRKNCTGGLGKSAGYALRNFVARITGVFKKNVDVFIVQSQFQKQKFIELGIPEQKIEILSGITPEINLENSSVSQEYVTFVGRVSPEKGIDDFISAARRMPEIKYAIAGDVPDGAEYDSPANVEWKGFLNGRNLDDLYQQSAVIVVPSRWYEGFPNVITRAMYHSKPVITTDIGCFPDIIDHGINGFMYPSGNIDKLVEHIKWIIRNPDEALVMGQNGRKKAEKEYSREVIYKRLLGIYSKAMRVEA